MKKKEYQKKLEKEKRELREYNELNHGINVKAFLIISLCVVGFVFLMFAFTKIRTGEWNLFTKKNTVTYKAEVQTTKILCGSILNREDSEYYVLAFEMQEDNASLYESVVERYNSGSNTLPLYKVDFSNSRNNLCKGDSLSLTNDVTSLKLVVPTLIRVRNGQIVENYTSYDSIKNVLFSYVD